VDLKTEMLKQLLAWALPALGGLALVYAMKGLRALIQLLREKAASTRIERVANAFAHLSDLVVADFEVTVVPAAKEKMADGQLTKEEILELRDLAVDRVKAIAAQHLLAEVQSLFGDVESYLLGHVERAVTRLKLSRPAEPLPVPH
jgi:hypothetical protein